MFYLKVHPEIQSMLNKKILSFFFLLGLCSLSVQSQILSPEEVVLKGRTTLAPAYLRQTAWMPGTDTWVWVNAEFLLGATLHEEETDTLLSLSELNRMHHQQELDSLKAFPFLNWQKDRQFWYIHKGHVLSYHLPSQTLTVKNTFDEKISSPDLETNFFSVAYTRDNNLYINSRGSEIRVTQDPDTGIVNGQAVHRSEFGITKGTFWSPKGNCLAFYRMDESMVTQYPVLDLAQTPAGVRMVRYPMAGSVSHQVKIGVFHILKHKTVWLNTGLPADQYLTNITWSPDEKYIYTAVLNRDQNHMKLQQYDAFSGELVKTLFEEKDEKYVEPQNPLYFIGAERSQFIWQSERTGHNHLYLYDLQGKLIRPLTEGNWDITEILGLSGKGNDLYCMGTGNSGLSRHLYRVNLEGGVCTQLTQDEGTHACRVNLETGEWLDIYSALKTPRETFFCDAEGNKKRTLLSAVNPLAAYDSCRVELVRLFTEDSVVLNGRIIYPAAFDSTRKYPVLLYVYGGPHAQLVTDNWLGGADLWLYSMAQKGYLVFTLDNRGSGNRGKKFEQYTFRNLGKKEAEDQMLGMEYLKTMDFVDASRCYVFGWSFGGFMSLNLMSAYPDAFKAGIAGGPVCDWNLYEIMYTERYMDTPEANAAGFTESRILDRVGKIKGDMLIIHGTEDDVVVWQHSLRLQENAVKQGVVLDFINYPGHEHNVQGKDRAHMYKAIEKYLKLR